MGAPASRTEVEGQGRLRVTSGGWVAASSPAASRAVVVGAAAFASHLAAPGGARDGASGTDMDTD